MYQTKKIKELITKVDNLSKKNNLDNILYLDTSNLVNNRIIELQELNNNFPSRAKQIIKKGDILLSQVRPYLNHNGIITKQIDGLIASTGFSVLRVTSEINEYYLFYLLQSGKYKERINMLADTSGSTYPSFKHSDLINTKIDFVTDVIEQKKIGYFFKEIDEEINIIANYIINLKLINKLLINKVFEQLRNNNDNRELINFCNKKTIRNNENLPVLTITKENGVMLQSDRFDRLIASEDRNNYITLFKNNYVYRPPGLKEGYISRNTLDFDGIVSPLYCVFEVDNLDFNFFDCFIKSNEFKKQIYKYSEGTARDTFSWDDFVNIKIPMSSTIKQKEIGILFNHISSLINDYEKLYKLKETKKRYYLNKIFC